jgi:hypothetical protein
MRGKTFLAMTFLAVLLASTWGIGYALSAAEVAGNHEDGYTIDSVGAFESSPSSSSEAIGTGAMAIEPEHQAGITDRHEDGYTIDSVGLFESSSLSATDSNLSASGAEPSSSGEAVGTGSMSVGSDQKLEWPVGFDARPGIDGP